VTNYKVETIGLKSLFLTFEVNPFVSDTFSATWFVKKRLNVKNKDLTSFSLDARLQRNIRRAGISSALPLTYLNSDLFNKAGYCAYCVSSEDVCPCFHSFLSSRHLHSLLL
jgi:hypothetical protein